MTRVAIMGAAGRMGRMLVQATLQAEEVTLGAALVRPDSSLLGADVGELMGTGKSGVLLTDGLEQVINDVDVVIDFTTPSLTLEVLALCDRYGKAMVVGTTGLNEQQEQALAAGARRVPVVYAANLSTGVNVTLNLVALAARALADAGYDIEVMESHHRHKVDAPSGTALMLGRAAADACGRSLRTHGVFAREGQCGPRTDDEIGFSVIRAGDIVGEHTVMFATEGERIEISHRASSRLTFAKGAVRAAQWVASAGVGLYDMQDVLGLRPLGQ